MKKQPRRWFRILTAIGIASLMIVGILAIQTFSIIRRAASIRHCPCAASAHVHQNSWIFIYKEMSISFISLTVFYRLVSWKSSWKTGT